MTKVLCLMALIGCGTQTHQDSQKDQLKDLCIEQYLEQHEDGPYDTKEINACIENPGVAISKQLEVKTKEKSFSNREIQ